MTKTRKVFLCLLVIPLILGLAACAQPAVAGVVIQSDNPRDTSPDVGDTDLAMLVNGNSDFAFDLYQALNKSMFSSARSSLLCSLGKADGSGER